MNPLQLGLNPYGLTYTTGLQAIGTARENPSGVGLTGFVEIAREIGAESIEIDDRWLRAMSTDELASLRDELAAAQMIAIVSSSLAQQAGETLEEPVRCAAGIGATIIRLGLSPVLEGSRAAWGARWD